VRPGDLPDAVIWHEIEVWARVGPDYVQLVLALASTLFDEEILRSACRRVGSSYDALVYPQLAAGERSVSTQQAFDLVALADVARRDPVAAQYFSIAGGTFEGFRDALGGTPFLSAFERFISQYGHRGHYESDWALPRYREEPSPILFAIQAHLADARPDEVARTADRLERAAADAWRALVARTTWWQRLTLVPRVKSTIRRLKRRYVMREKARSDLTRVLAEVRRWHLELAVRFVSRGWLRRRDDYFLLHFSEIGAVISDPATGPELAAIAERRGEQLAVERPLRMPMLMRESGLPAMVGRVSAEGPLESPRLNGLCVSPGCVDGEIVVILDPRHFRLMKRGAILVAPATDPSWTPLFTLAAGVIVEVGGMLSHASTIAREYGLPALANVKDATRRLRTGERVRLDATGGVVVPCGAGAPVSTPEPLVCFEDRPLT
ncbi:MAG: hypothetical protein GEU82_19125, partial [Luteitalea sp.]|nr:hypothetical protein [Luteitalea sp.]